MIAPCPMCGKEALVEDAKRFKIKLRKKYDSVAVCSTCFEFLVAHEKIDGKLVIERCKECGSLRKVHFQEYKKRGRPKGSHNKPRPRPEIAVPLDKFAGPITTTDEKFVQYTKKETT